MGVDLASLVLAVDSTQVDKGSSALDKLAEAGGGASKSTLLLAAAGVTVAGALATAAAAAMSMVKEAIHVADAMNDTHLKTGLALKDIAAYDLLARQSGSSVEGYAQAFKFLGKSMTGHRRELDDLGITAKDSNVAMGQFADLLASINDPALRTTVAIKYLGRSAQEMMPAMMQGSVGIEEARKATEKYGTQLAKAAPMADHFNDNLEVMKTNSKVLGMTLANELLPRLNLITDSMVKAGEKSGGLGSAWAGVKGVFQQVFNPLMALAMQVSASFTEVVVSFNKMMANVTTGNAKSSFLATAETEAKNLARIYKQMAELDVSGAGAAAQHAEGVKKLTAAQEEAIRTSEERAKAAKKAADKYAALVKASQDFIKSLKEESEKYGMSSIEIKQYEAATMSLTLSKGRERDAFVTATAAWIEDIRVKQEASAAARIHNEVMTQFIDEEEAAQKKINDGISGLRLKVEAMQEESLKLTLTDAQLREHIILRDLEKSGLDASTEAYKEMERQLRTASKDNEVAKEAKKNADDQKHLWKSVENAGHDAFMHIGDTSKTVGQRIKDMLQHDILEMLWQMTMKKWIIQIEKQVTSSGSDIGGDLLGGLGKMLGFGGSGPVAASDTGYAVGNSFPFDPSGYQVFEGGGDTGNGPRSGGLDGKGGFMAMMHPQETVTDRTKGSGGGNGDVSIVMPVSITIQGNADTNVIRQALNEAEARIYRNVPAVIRKAQLRARVTPTV